MKTATKYYVIKDRKGNLMIGSKVCTTKTGCKNSYNSMIDKMLWDKMSTRLQQHDEFWNIKSLANEGYGCPKVVDDIDMFMLHVRDKNLARASWCKPVKINRCDVLYYNEVIEEITTDWQVEELVVL